ncbi:MAG: phage tail protein, partial [Thermoanaerobaculia bacterium]|nr:phage tail protein [Thermoanaerobaculia bacterium]
LTVNQIPAHSHPLLASSDAASTLNPGGGVLGTPSTATPFFAAAPNLSLAPQAVTSVGGSQPHTNFQPYLCVDFIISLFGIFPSPT